MAIHVVRKGKQTNNTDNKQLKTKRSLTESQSLTLKRIIKEELYKILSEEEEDEIEVVEEVEDEITESEEETEITEEEDETIDEARQITDKIVNAFLMGNKARMSNSYTDGQSLFLYRTEIAKIERDGTLWINTDGFVGGNGDAISNTTKERLNGLPGVSIQVKRGVTYLNNKIWDGDWIEIGDLNELMNY